MLLNTFGLFCLFLSLKNIVLMQNWLGGLLPLTDKTNSESEGENNERKKKESGGTGLFENIGTKLQHKLASLSEKRSDQKSCKYSVNNSTTVDTQNNSNLTSKNPNSLTKKSNEVSNISKFGADSFIDLDNMKDIDPSNKKLEAFPFSILEKKIFVNKEEIPINSLPVLNPDKIQEKNSEYDSYLNKETRERDKTATEYSKSQKKSKSGSNCNFSTKSAEIDLHLF